MPKRNGPVTVYHADGRVEVVKASKYKPKPKSRRAELRYFRKTKHWRVLRKQALERDGHRCTRCHGGEKLEVHHLTYARLGQELLGDVQTLCQGCHAAEHRWQMRARAA